MVDYAVVKMDGRSVATRHLVLLGGVSNWICITLGVPCNFENIKCYSGSGAGIEHNNH